MKYEINIRSKTAVYTQIVNQIRFAIASGELKGGDQLPSVREFSETLGVNPNTIAKSYRDLEVMGYLFARRGMGVYIDEGVKDKCVEACRLDLVHKIHEISSEAKAVGMATKEVIEIVNACWDTEGFIYRDTPASLTRLAKMKLS